MTGDTHTSVLAIYLLPVVFLIQIMSLTHYPIACQVTVYILKTDLLPLDSPYLQLSLLILEV